MSPTIFLSTVTSEFVKLRSRLASLLEGTKRLHVRHQDDFVERGVLTLHKLQEEVEASTVVFHVIGAANGSCPPVDQVEDLLKRLPDFESRLGDVVAAARGESVTYTQWELWLAAYYGKRLCSYQFEERLSYEQQAHLELMRAHQLYAKKVNDDEGLYDQVILTLIELKLLTDMEARKIIHLPYPSIGLLFKGRDEFLDKLRASLKRKTSAITSNVLHGLGGIGKTRLAVEYAWQHVNNYHALLFVVADSPANLRRNLSELAGPLVLDLGAQKATEEDVRFEAALRWLQQNPGWFLILDNVDDEETAQSVEDLIAKLHGGEILITSRIGRWSEAVEPLELSVLAEGTAASFLLERTIRSRNKQLSDDTDARELACELGGLALALEQAGAYISQQRLSFREYLNLWKSHETTVQKWHDPRSMKYPRCLAVTWQATFEQLGEAERLLLDVLAWFAPEKLPLSVFGNCEILPNTIDWTNVFRPSIANLANFSMLHWDVQNETVSVHRVVQEIIRKSHPNPSQYLSYALHILENSIPDFDSDNIDFWVQWEPLHPHIEFTVVQADQKGILNPTSKIMAELGSVLTVKALFADAEKFKRRALEIDEVKFGSNSAIVAIRLHNLATLLSETNRLVQAEQLLRRVLQIWSVNADLENGYIASALNNLSSILYHLNRLDEAETTLRQAISVWSQRLGPDHSYTLAAYSNLAAILMASNRLAEAEAEMCQMLQVIRASPQSSKLLAASIMNNLAQLRASTGRVAEAEELLRESLAIIEGFYESRHPEVAGSLSNLALLLEDTNREAEAEIYFRKALEIDEKSYGPNHPTVAIRLNNLAQLLTSSGRDAEAEPLMRRALAIDEESQGNGHPDVAIHLNNLSLLLLKNMRLAEAESTCRRALQIWEASLVPTHPHIGTAISNLAMILTASNRLIDAEVVSRRLLSYYRAYEIVSGFKHAHLCTSTENYRSLLRELGKSESEIDQIITDLLT